MSDNCIDASQELRIAKSDKGEWLFGSGRYVVPLYQREYAWRSDVEIERLIADIQAFNPGNDDRCYRLGSVSVMKRENGELEVIDGQQRLTTLYLMLTALNSACKAVTKSVPSNDIFNPDDSVLTFEGRMGSTCTLQNAEALHCQKINKVNVQSDNGILAAYEGLRSWAHGLSEKKLKDFLKRLEQTAIYRIPVPEKTDLCKFFIRMNTRGKQLELSDVLKAQLMKHLTPDDLAWFNSVWTACSNMNTYLKKSLTQETWSEFFSPEALNAQAFTRMNHTDVTKDVQTNQLAAFADYFLDSANSSAVAAVTLGNVAREADFESFIDFPTFLMHTLKLCALNRGKSCEGATNDKRLLTFFEEHWKTVFDLELNTDASSQNNLPQEVRPQASWADVLEFLRTLVIARHLYDGWILKRLNKDWIIKHLADNVDKPNVDSLVNSYQEGLHKKILMIQSCLRVTYTSSHTMPWVTKLLHLLWDNKNNPDASGQAVLNELEKLAINEVNDKMKDKDSGTGTPRILFNFLNYLLWREGLVSDNPEDEKRREKFQFAYWNSVEHWYPQTPDNSMKDDWPDQKPSVDIFGNLFLLNSSDNSSLSNMLPVEKRRRLEDKVVNEQLMLSLKAVDMMRATERATLDGHKQSWQTACLELQKKHLLLLEGKYDEYRQLTQKGE